MSSMPTKLVSKLISTSPDELLQINGKGSSAQLQFVVFASLTLFIALGVAQAISIRYSVGGNGSVDYDASAAVLGAELLKLAFSVVWLVCFNRKSIPTPSRIPAPWLYESMTLLVAAFLFAMQNQLAYMVVQRLGASLFVILGNLKIVFTCIFMRLVLGTFFSHLQWIAVAMMTLSAMMLKLPVLLLAAPGVVNDKHVHDIVVGILLMLLSTGSSGLSSVVNELVLKRNTIGQEMPFMAKNAVLYMWGVVLNFIVWKAVGVHPFLAWSHGNGVFPVLCMTGMGLSCSVVLRYLDNIHRCFAACLQVLLTVTLARFVLPMSMREEPFGIFYVVSLLMLAVAIVIYQNHESPRLFQYVIQAFAGTFVVCGCCVGLDRRG